MPKRHYTKKIALSKTERNILFMLAEAGEEDISSILGSLLEGVENHMKYHLIKDIENALRHLLELRFIDVLLDKGKKIESVDRDQKDTLLRIDQHIQWYFNSESYQWKHEKTKEGTLLITLTNQGEENLAK